MVTYESLKELAHALSKITGYRYVAFLGENTTDLFIKSSNSEMRWYPSESHPCGGFWYGELDLQLLDLRDLPQLDWSKCQFDCKEAENDK